MTINQLVNEVVADGKLEMSEVQALRANIMEDGVVDRDEANALFDLTDALEANTLTADTQSTYDAFQDLVREAVVSHLTNDEESPGAVDESEANWLISKVEGDGTISNTERRLCGALRDWVASMGGTLHPVLAQKFQEWGV